MTGDLRMIQHGEIRKKKFVNRSKNNEINFNGGEGKSGRVRALLLLTPLVNCVVFGSI